MKTEGNQHGILIHKVHSGTTINEDSSKSLLDVTEVIYMDDNALWETIDENYTSRSLLGIGSSAEVHLVEHLASGRLFACKIVREDASMNDVASMKMEQTILRLLDHPNIVRTEAIYTSRDSGSFLAVMEYMSGGELRVLNIF
jgi:serine/threonine protein kinase